MVVSQFRRPDRPLLPARAQVGERAWAAARQRSSPWPAARTPGARCPSRRQACWRRRGGWPPS